MAHIHWLWTIQGSTTSKVSDIVVRPGQVYSLTVKLSIATTAQQVEVNAAAVSLDTESTNSNSVVNDAAVQNISLNGCDFTQLVSLQLRAEMFNIFNRTNLSNPIALIASSTLGRSSCTRNSGGAPGIGPGEPFNVQFAGQIIF